MNKFFIVSLLLLISPFSNAALIDFEDTNSSGWYRHSIESNDFIFSKLGGWMGVNQYGSWLPTSSYNGSKDIEMGFGNFLMGHSTLDLFNLDGLDAGLSWYNHQLQRDLTITGFQESNGEFNFIETKLTLDHEYETFSLTGFDSLRLVIFSGQALNSGYIAMDNIQVSAVSVPEPLMLPLISIGLAGLVIARRKRSCT
jgi:hypothetical protein